MNQSIVQPLFKFRGAESQIAFQNPLTQLKDKGSYVLEVQGRQWSMVLCRNCDRSKNCFKLANTAKHYDSSFDCCCLRESTECGMWWKWTAVWSKAHSTIHTWRKMHKWNCVINDLENWSFWESKHSVDNIKCSNVRTPSAQIIRVFL